MQKFSEESLDILIPHFSIQNKRIDFKTLIFLYNTLESNKSEMSFKKSSFLIFQYKTKELTSNPNFQ